MAVVSMDTVRAVLTYQNLGEGVHTAFRKCDAVTDMKVWNAIRAMPTDQWSAVMAWVADALIYQIEREAIPEGDEVTCSACDAECSGH